MGFLSAHLGAFSRSLTQVDAVLEERCPLAKKTDELRRFALSIKARSKPCVRKHFKGAIAAGASRQEIAYIFALTMREAAGADDCWPHSVIGDLVERDAESSGGCS